MKKVVLVLVFLLLLVNLIPDYLWLLIPLFILVWMLKLIAIPSSSSSKGEEGERTARCGVHPHLARKAG